MLKVQEWLLNHNNDFKLLEDTYGIHSTFHEDGRVILNYDQLKSDKKEQIVRECRGLVLNSHHPEHLVARGFRRFFNYGELKDEERWFNWDNCIIYHKEDGSYISTCRYDGKYHLHTRASFGNGDVVKDVMTWHNLFELAVPNWKLRQEKADYGGEIPQLTLIWELCSKYNKVVRDYPNPTSFLLTAFQGEQELTDKAVDDLAEEIGVARPKKVVCKDIMDVQKYIQEVAEHDVTFEGVVIRDCHNHRFKVKSEKYLILHRLANNGNLLSNMSYARANLIPLILQGEESEITCYYPELIPLVDDIKSKIKTLTTEMENIWFCFHDTKKQKDFAKEALKSPLSSLLFKARKDGGKPSDYLPESSQLLIKILT